MWPAGRSTEKEKVMSGQQYWYSLYFCWAARLSDFRRLAKSPLYLSWAVCVWKGGSVANHRRWKAVSVLLNCTGMFEVRCLMIQNTFCNAPPLTAVGQWQAATEIQGLRKTKCVRAHNSALWIIKAGSFEFVYARNSRIKELVLS